MHLSKKDLIKQAEIVACLIILGILAWYMIEKREYVNASATDINPDEYIIRVDPNGGYLPNTVFGDKNGMDEVGELKVYYGELNNNRIGIPTRPGLQFAGYYDAPTGGNRVYDLDGDAVEGTYWLGWYGKAQWRHRGNITVYARWKGNAYTVKYDANGGKGKIANQTFSCGTIHMLPTTGITRKNYELIGWCYNEFGKDVIYKAGTYISDLGTATELVTMYAMWKRKGAGFVQRPLLDDEMFFGMYEICGENGTTYHSEYTDSRYAHIDQSGNPGYFSRRKGK